MRFSRLDIFSAIDSDNLELFKFRSRYINEIDLKSDILARCIVSNRFEIFVFYFKKRIKNKDKYFLLKQTEIHINTFSIFGPSSSYQHIEPFRNFVQNQLRIVKLKKLFHD